MAGRVKSIDQRSSSRVPIRILVEYEEVDDFLADYTSNLSLGGMYVQTDEPLVVGTRFRLRFRVPGRRKPVATYGEVRWSIPANNPSGLTPGMGIQFDALAPMDKKAVEEWMQGDEG